MQLHLALVALCLTLAGPAASDPITHPGWATCGNEDDRASVAGCTLLLSPKAKQSPREREFALYSRGRSHYFLKNYDAAVADFTAVVAMKLPKLPPDSDELSSSEGGAYHFRGIIHAEKGDLQQALADFNAAIKVGQIGLFYEDRAKVHARLGQDDRALADFNEAIRIYPWQERFYEARGALHQKLGQPDRADQDWAEARRLTALKERVQSERARATPKPRP